MQQLASPSGVSGTKRLSLALFHNCDRDRLFMIISMYLDESGTHGSTQMTLGGVVGTLGQWIAFDKQWNKLLKDSGAPYAHMKSLRDSKKHFRGWRGSQKAAFVKGMDKILSRHALFAFTVTLNIQEYKSIYRAPDAPRKARFDSAYGFCLRACLSFVPELVRVKYDNPKISVIMELGHKNYGDAERVFYDIKHKAKDEWLRSALVSITAGDKTDFPGLQGADAIAHIGWGYESEERPPQIEMKNGETAESIIKAKTRLAKAPIFRNKIDAIVLADARAKTIAEIKRRQLFGSSRTRHSSG